MIDNKHSTYNIWHISYAISITNGEIFYIIIKLQQRWANYCLWADRGICVACRCSQFIKIRTSEQTHIFLWSRMRPTRDLVDVYVRMKKYAHLCSTNVQIQLNKSKSKMIDVPFFAAFLFLSECSLLIRFQQKILNLMQSCVLLSVLRKKGMYCWGFGWLKIKVQGLCGALVGDFFPHINSFSRNCIQISLMSL